MHSYTNGVFSGWRMPNHNFSSESNEPDHLLIFSINIMNTIRNNKRVSRLDVNNPRKYFCQGFRPFYSCQSIRKADDLAQSSRKQIEFACVKSLYILCYWSYYCWCCWGVRGNHIRQDTSGKREWKKHGSVRKAAAPLSKDYFVDFFRFPNIDEVQKNCASLTFI